MSSGSLNIFSSFSRVYLSACGFCISFISFWIAFISFWFHYFFYYAALFFSVSSFVFPRFSLSSSSEGLPVVPLSLSASTCVEVAATTSAAEMNTF
jgi:hypothetical protein